MVLKSRKHKSKAFAAGVIIITLLYSVAVFADFIAPYDYRDQTRMEPSGPPTRIRMRDENGGWHMPFVYQRKLVDARNMAFQEVTAERYPIVMFAQGSSHNILGLIPTTRHLIGVEGDGDAAKLRLLGTDQLGRDRFSRLAYAIRFSLVVSPIGTLLACFLGIMIGSVSGFAHRTVDTILMGVADTMIALPTLILILAVRTAFPLELPPLTAAGLLIGIFALTGWAEMARLSRGLVVAAKQREYILAARASGLTELSILWRHIIPHILRPIMIQATLLLPFFLLAEVALSFLGVGLQEPEPSLGNMLSAASDLTVLRNSPFVLLSPAIVIFLFVLGIRLIGWKRERMAMV